MALAETAKLVAALELQDKFSGPARRVDGSISRLEGSVGRLDKVGSNVSRGIASIATNLIKVGTIAGGIAAVGIAASVREASNLNEELDKAAVVFGPAADELVKFAEGASSIGLSTAEALGAAGAFGNMFNTVGLAQKESADMSETMVQLASDMASFNNEDPTEMLDRLRSGLSGEAEPLRRFGVLLSEATVKEFAYRTGIAKSGDVLTEAQKVQARYGLILEQTTIQQGNFADTSGSLANQQRELSANLKNTAATLGTALLPKIATLASRLNDILGSARFRQAAEKLGESIAGIFTDERIESGVGMITGLLDKFNQGEGGGLTANISDISGGIGNIAQKLGDLPWQSIGDAAKLLGTGSKALLDAFLGLPPWVQTAVLTGWGLNKLTGGALGGIVTELGKGLIKGVLNMNAAVVHVNAKTVTGTGGGLPTGPGGGGKFNPLQFALQLVPVIAALEGGAKLAGGTGPIEGFFTPDKLAQVTLNTFDKPVNETLDNTATENLAIAAKAAADRKVQLQRLEEGNRYADTLNRNQSTIAERAHQDRVEGKRYAAQLNSIVATSQEQRTQAARLAEGNSYVRGLNSTILNTGNTTASRLDTVRSRIETGNVRLSEIRNKKTSVNVTAQFNAQLNVSAANVTQQIQAYSFSTAGRAYID